MYSQCLAIDMLQSFEVGMVLGGPVQTAFKCATVLRDTISPYLLRRMKIDVKNHLSLPNKNEQVLFCGLSEEQRTLYRHYLDGNEVKSIINGRLQVFVGLINLRKICNHPDLHDGGPKHLVNEDLSDLQPNLQYGWFKRSGKMIVLHSILRLWKKQNHKALLFTQSRQMLCILEKFLTDESYEYLKMDGGTSVGSRQSIIDKFNNTPSIFIFLLTTRVGGLGVNLTGADRVIIYDPDWNPSTDTQARERAWRIGQKRHVTIYRLLTAGTIEEKIYHRQIFKQFLTNRVLKDPKQQRFFKTNDLFELFTLNEGEQEKTESAAIFAGTGSEIIVKSKEKKSNRGTLVDKDKKNRDLKIKDTSCNKVIDNIYNSEVRKNSNDNCNSEQILNNEDIETKTEDLANENFGHAETESLNCGVYNKQQVTDLYNSASSKNECSKIRLENDEKAKRISQLQNKSFENDLEKKKKMMALAKLLSKKISKKKLELNDDQKNNRASFKMEKLKKKMKKSKDYKKGKKFEGERIENLIKKRKFKYSSDEKEEELNKAQDDFVLQKLFKRSGVHTALSHDIILNADDPDYLLLESEAERVAKEALKQVRMSRTRCLQTRQRDGHSSDMINSLPRFGGKRSNLISTDSKAIGIKRKLDKNMSHKMFSGSEFVDDENEMPKDFSNTMSTSQRMHATSVEAGTSSGVLSSAQLLKRMRERNRTNTSLSHSSSEIVDPDDQLSLDSTVDSYDPRYPSTAIFNINTEIDPYMQSNVDLLTDIRNFVSFQATVDGQASTDEVVERFRDRVPNNQNHIFKALLKQIM
ncbi:DNA excision repair protein ERCC-6 [Armadillidium nasatum]|uniref:DNA excision repair protein ERCC-6 n=1 Tax=Armadillidium nasatum TaxID=96803 RepID=A0A5N5TH15_9CRUS|nr:DNA excision repair protein ERCC-6 [Armadillidium nasatum]